MWPWGVVDLDRGEIDSIQGRAGHHPDRDHSRIVAPQGFESASYTVTRNRSSSASFVRPKYTRFVRTTRVRSFGGSTQALVPVKPVCPNASSLKNGRDRKSTRLNSSH